MTGQPPKIRTRRKRPAVSPLRAEQIRREMQVEQALLRRIPSATIARTLATEWGVSERHVWRFIAKVRGRWEIEATEELKPESRSVERAHMRASLNDVYQKAMGRRVPVVDATGNPVLDPTTGKPLTQERPDLGKAISVARLLVDLDGLQAPPPVQQIAVQASVTQAVAQVDADALASFLTRLPAAGSRP